MARPGERVVVDSGVLVSRLLLPDSTAARAVRAVVDEARLLVSAGLLDELADVLARPRFDAYVARADRREFLLRLGQIAEIVAVTSRIRACRDPDDDKVLERAVDGAADAIVTGDRDLLVLHPFRGIPILTPAAYLRS
jgi:putative PIN family toxin of toxin-antitoxin system